MADNDVVKADSGRRRRRMFRSWFTFGTTGVMEAFVAGLLLLIVVNAQLPRAHGPVEVVLAIGLCVAAGLSGRWPIPAAIAVAAQMAVFIFTPPEWTGLAIHAFIVPVIALSAREGRAKWYLSGAYFLLMIAIEANRPDLGPAKIVYALAWAVLIGIAMVIGTSFLYLARVKDAERAALIRQQRHAVARDLHDTVAHELSLAVMRVEQAQLQGSVTPADLDFVLDACRRSIRDLRGILTILRDDTTPEAPQRVRLWESASQVLAQSDKRLRELGFHPEINIQGELAELPRSVDDTLAWILREASANVARHGDPAEPCTFVVDVQPDQVEAMVTNSPLANAPAGRRGGMGLIGLRERLEAFGGSLFVGKADKGPFVLQAVIPTE